MSQDSAKRRIGPFELDEEIGSGGMGKVYRATYLKNGMVVAVKVLAPDLTADEKIAKRFIRETEILKKLKHPHIVRYYGAGSTRAQRFYAMELVTGGTLDNLIREKGRLPWQEVVHYGIQIAKALEHAHHAGIVHRDLKPGNLLISSDGVLKLSDFGIARDTQATALTQAGKTLGTMHYMAPEQISGKQPVSRRTDLYALGCVLFQMLTGRTPFESNSQAELLFKHLDEKPPSVRDVDIEIPLWLAELIDELLAKDPQDRPFDALAVQVRLQEVEEKVKEQETRIRETTQEGQSALTQAHSKTRKKRRKKKAAKTPIYERTWFLATGLALVVLFIIWALLPPSEETLYARVKVHMDRPEPTEWIHAEQDLERMLMRFPDGKRAEQARLWLDQIEMHRAERRADTNIRFGRPPQSEAERLYVEAQQYEKFGDRLTALEKYDAMPNVIEMSDETRPYLNLARKRSQEIRASVGGDTDRSAFIRAQLDEAEKLYERGDALAAREKWQAIIRLYGNIPEFEAYTAEARERISGG